MKDQKIMKYISKKIAARITEAWIEYEVDYNEKTGRMDNRYYVVLDGEEHFFNNLNHMIYMLKNEY